MSINGIQGQLLEVTGNTFFLFLLTNKKQKQKQNKKTPSLCPPLLFNSVFGLVQLLGATS
jgi:hypothetical protein